MAPPGTDRASRATGSHDGTIALLSVGSLVPRKGYDVLLAALATLRDLPWRLSIVGARRDEAAAAQIEADIVGHDLVGRVVLAGAVTPERLSALYDNADVFVLASRHEGYGMAFAEAIAHGLAVIGTTAGAIPDTVPEAAGILVPPDDVPALAAALRRIVGDAAERARLADGASGRCGAAPDLAVVGADIRPSHRGRNVTSFKADWLALREPYDRKRAQFRRACRGRRDLRRPAIDQRRRSRLRHRLDAARGVRAAAGAPELALGRQRSQPAGPCQGGIVGRGSSSIRRRSTSRMISRQRSTAPSTS